MNFGDKLKKLRNENNLTQDELGNIFGVTKSCISFYEKGNRQPSVDILIKTANYFKVSIDYLLDVDNLSPKNKPSTFNNL